jgi:hypothetical protein
MVVGRFGSFANVLISYNVMDEPYNLLLDNIRLLGIIYLFISSLI